MSQGNFGYLIETDQLEKAVAHATIRVEKKFFTKRIIDQYRDFLQNHAKFTIRFKGSRAIFPLVFSYLEEEFNVNFKPNPYQKYADEIMAKRSNLSLVLTCEHKTQYLELLTSASFSEPKLWDFNKEFFSDDDTNLPQQQIQGIEFILRCLEIIPDDKSVVLLSIE